MPDLESIHGAGAAGQEAPNAPLPPRRPCPNCSAELAFLPAAARFCRRCGTQLAAVSPPAATHTPTESAARQTLPRQLRPTRWFFNLWCACTDSEVEETPHVPSRSEVLLAYGKSMFNLGWRYEHALGARRNLSEAARCYWKAARLGDPSAVGRLGQGRVSASHPVELPPPATSA